MKNKVSNRKMRMREGGQWGHVHAGEARTSMQKEGQNIPLMGDDTSLSPTLSLSVSLYIQVRIPPLRFVRAGGGGWGLGGRSS